jgi:DNA-binding transcriptional LysR family regulator
MELRHLRYFVAVAEELNFTRAAERLNMAQPPLSTQIRSLEEELGVRLFDRDKRRVDLTQAGRQMLVRARAILAAADDAVKEIRRTAAGEIGELLLGYAASAMFTELLPATLRAFQKALPNVQLVVHEMTSRDQLYAIHARKLDLGILRRPDMPVPPGVRMEEWYTASLVAAIPKGHPLAKKASIRVTDLQDQPLIAYPRDSGIGLYWRVIDLCVKAGFQPRIVREARDASVMMGLVSAGIGISIVPADTQCIRLEGVVYRQMEGPEAFSALHIAYRTADRNEHLLALLAELRRSHAEKAVTVRKARTARAPAAKRKRTS